jgi:cysteine protease ATG4
MLPYVSDPTDLSPEHLASCHTRRLRRLHMKEMDPSMLLAFLIHDQDDWEEWKTGVEEVQGKSIIHVLPHSPPAGGTPVREEAVEEVESLDEDEDELC